MTDASGSSPSILTFQHHGTATRPLPHPSTGICLKKILTLWALGAGATGSNTYLPLTGKCQAVCGVSVKTISERKAGNCRGAVIFPKLEAVKHLRTHNHLLHIKLGERSQSVLKSRLLESQRHGNIRLLPGASLMQTNQPSPSLPPVYPWAE